MLLRRKYVCCASQKTSILCLKILKFNVTLNAVELCCIITTNYFYFVNLFSDFILHYSKCRCWEAYLIRSYSLRNIARAALCMNIEANCGCAITDFIYISIYIHTYIKPYLAYEWLTLWWLLRSHCLWASVLKTLPQHASCNHFLVFTPNTDNLLLWLKFDYGCSSCISLVLILFT